MKYAREKSVLLGVERCLSSSPVISNAVHYIHYASIHDSPPTGWRGTTGAWGIRSARNTKRARTGASSVRLHFVFLLLSLETLPWPCARATWASGRGEGGSAPLFLQFLMSVRNALSPELATGHGHYQKLRRAEGTSRVHLSLWNFFILSKGKVFLTRHRGSSGSVSRNDCGPIKRGPWPRKIT